MKTVAKIGGLLVVTLLAVSLLGCQSPTPQEPPAPPMPPLQRGPEAVLIEVSSDEFSQTKHIEKEVDIIYPGSLIVILASNPTTGFQWPENAAISSPAVISQYEHNYVDPSVVAGSTTPPGAPGKDVWTFNSVAKGTSTITMDYSRPWEGGEKGELTFKVTVNVK